MACICIGFITGEVLYSVYMSNETIILIGTAATLGLIHTVIGPDHYLPFIVLARARRWSAARTAFITFLSGLGHVLSSIILGFCGLAMGIAVFRLESVEAFRGEIAAWLLMAFGFTYFVWGIHRAIRNRPHRHFHLHDESDGHDHSHAHTNRHTHVHESKTASLTPWVLFTIFIFGPCEPLIPLIMYSAARGSMASAALVASAFGLTTIGTMLIMVYILSFGLSKLSFGKLERYSHALAGLTILLSGSAIKLLGL